MCRGYPSAYRLRTNLVRSGKSRILRLLLPLVQSKRRRSKDAYLNGRTIPIHTHVAKYTDQEVKNYQLVRTAVVQPLIEGSSFPDWVEVQANCVGRRNNSTCDDVVTKHQGTCNRFADAVDVHWGSSDEGDDVADGCS